MAISTQHEWSMNNGINPIGTIHDPLDMGTFQHRLYLRIFEDAMTLEWDWADMTGYTGYEDGISMNGVLSELAKVPMDR